MILFFNMDRYQRVKKIGEGAFGKAVLVRHKQTNRQCVVKEINIMRMAAREREDARKEVAVLGQLKHPNIITYIESFEEAGTLFIVMNYCAGGDLYAKINSQHGRLFTEEQVLNWFVQICLAMKHIHDRKILHRDIKSQNIFLTSSGTVQLGDFGIAKVLNNTVELARTCIGTPYYLSPEIVENKPYNNKSDIWSLGCVLYELTTLKHAFEAGNMKNLVLKIIRGSYPPIPPQYSYDLRGLVAQLFKRAPRDRPSISSVLRKNFIMERVRRLLSAEEIADEFSHTVIHGARIAKALPPAPRPSSAPKRAAGNPPRPGSAGRGRYNPANVYGVPVGRKSQNRSSGDLKKKGGSGGGAGGVNRPVPIPGQQDWEQRKKEMVEREQKRREENKKKYEEQVARRHQNLVEKQKMDRINRAREDGWKQLINSPEDKDQARPQTPVVGGGVARPLPMPRQQPEPVQPNFQQNRGPKEAGNYDHYIAYLDKLKMQRQEREKEMNQRGQDYMPAPRPLPNNLDNPPAVQAAQAINQANYDRKMAGQAAERARIVEDYVQRRQAAAANKARGQADLNGGRPPSGRGRRTPEPRQRPGAAKQPIVAERNKAEQEYLEKLRQIREQNMRERRNLIQQRAGIPSPVDAEERKKKSEALKQQAEDWAKKKKDQLAKEKQQLLKQQQDKIKQQQGSRPNSARAKMTPAPAVPVSGVLHLIGANQKAAPPGGQELASPSEEESPANVQQQKSDILKRLNDKTPGRGKWGADKEPVVPAAETATEEEEKVNLRRPWGEGGISPLAEPESARSQWGEEQLRLSDLPLEQTGSAMEATSARDQVVRNPGSARNQWGRPGSTVVKALNQLPISEGTVTLDDESQQENKESVKPPVTTKAAIGFTISLSDSPAPSPAPTPTPASQPTPTPSVKPPIRSGTIVLSSSESKLPAEPPSEPTSTAPAASAAASLGVVGGKGNVTMTLCQGSRKAGNQAESSPQPASDAPKPLLDQVQPSPDASLSLSGEEELPGSNRFFESEEGEIKILSGRHRLSTVLEGSKDFSESGVEGKTANLLVSEKSSSKPQTPPKSDGNEDGSEKNNVDLSDGGKPKVPEKPAIKPKPVLKPKPVVAEKPVLLPKPTLLPKPDQPYQFSEEAPVVVASSESSQVVFNKSQDTAASATPASPAVTLSAKGKLNTAERSDSVQKGLCTGNFDMKNVQMLRTCSEPDLTNLFRELDKQLQTKSTLTRHQSLDLTPENELQDDSLSQDESPVTSSPEEKEKPGSSPAEKEEETEDDIEDKEDDVDEEDDDDDEDLISMRETMQSLLLDDDDEEEEDALSPKIKFSLSSDVETSLKKAISKDSEEKADDAESSDGDQEDRDNDDNKEDESANQTVREKLPTRTQSDSLLVQKHKAEEGVKEDVGAAREGENEEEESGAAGEDEDDEEDDEERLLYNTADILTLRDSDEETVFGDEDDDLDLFSRLEHQREQLESELGFEKFIEIYKTVQALQEDEDENMEEGARIAISMLGPEKQHLYPRIFQLVMADTAFTEDNA